MQVEVPTPGQMRAARALLGWCQIDLAKRSGVNRNTVARYEVGLGQPIPSVVLALRGTLEAAGT